MIINNNEFKSSQRLWRSIYISFDFFIGVLAYTLLYSYRKSVIEPARFGLETMHWDDFYILGALITSFLWLFSMGMVGLYGNPIRKSRLNELSRAIQLCFVFSLIYFLLFLLNDYVKSYSDYFKTVGVFFLTLFIGTLMTRVLFGYLIQRKIVNGKYFFPTLLIGSRIELEKNIKALKKHGIRSGEKFIGWVNTTNIDKKNLVSEIPILGELSDISKIINKFKVKDCIVALPPKSQSKLTSLILDLESSNVRIFMIPDTYGILSGLVKIDEHGVPLLEWHLEPMTPWQRNTKRLFDIVISLFSLIVFSPIFILIALMVRMSGSPVFFTQKRLGKEQREFSIFKFRTMHVNAEETGPQLTIDKDVRVTPIGKFLRKYRIDELPQFLNVLIGHMSIVGPRPERSFFAKKIINQAPQYRHIYKVRPGLTSWGMVRYGYASNVEEMIHRMKFDLIYIENMSIFNDMKVLLYTIWTVLLGRGK